MPPDQLLGGEGLGSRAGDWAEACAALAAIPGRPAGAPRSRPVVAWLARMRDYLEQGFTVSEIGTGTMTGYYEPTLRGDLAPSGAFTTPLHAVPPRDWARRPPEPGATPPAPAAQAPEPATDEPPPIPALVWVTPRATPTDPAPMLQLQPAVIERAPAPTQVAAIGAETPAGTPRTEPRRPVVRSLPAVVGRPPPFPSRGEIDDGALAGHGLELVWVDNAVDAFFLHIQGSGRVLLPDGRLLRIGYAAQNGHAYRAIGRILIERGEMRREGMSMQAIRAWLAAADPEAARALMRANASYIFFRMVEGLRPEDGPIGAMGVPLTPLRSVAVDPAFVPMGAPLFLAPPNQPAAAAPSPRRPRSAAPPRDPTAPLPRLVVAQDTGGAIRGAGRTDMFWGWDAESGSRAGGTYQPARMFLLRPRPIN